MPHDRDTSEQASSKGGPPGKTNGAPPGDGPSGAAASAYVDQGWDSDLGTTIAQVVAEAEGVPPESLEGPPLYDRVHTGYLERALFASGTDESRETMVFFRYRGYRVCVRGDGYVYAVDVATE
jgi:hypothetical protein